MAVPKDMATVKASSLETEKVKIEGVFPSNEEPQEFTRGDGSTFTVERPYRIRIVDMQGNIVSEDVSTKTVSTPKWDKKFYQKDEYWNYTRGEVLLAVMQVLRQMNRKIAKECDEEGEFNINDLEGVEFDAVVGQGDGSNRWINWVLTFVHHGVWTPERTKSPEVKAEQAKEEASDSVDNTKTVEAMFGKGEPEKKPEKTRDEWIAEAKKNKTKLYFKDEDGDRIVATDTQYKDKKVELFVKEGTEFISTESGLPF